MIEGAERQLAAVPHVVGVVIPLAVSVFRIETVGNVTADMATAEVISRRVLNTDTSLVDASVA
jgi:hypothetical protein